MSSFTQRYPNGRRILRLGVFSVLLAACLGSAIWADPVGPRTEDRQITLSVRQMLKDHLTRHPLDKEMAARWMKTFLKSMDPMKFYFYQSDVDEFTKHQDDLMTMLQKNDISFAYVVFQAVFTTGGRTGENGRRITHPAPGLSRSTRIWSPIAN